MWWTRCIRGTCLEGMVDERCANEPARKIKGLKLMRFASEAKAAFNAGDYARAVALYRQAITAQPELAHLYQFSLERAQSHLKSSDGEPSSPLPPPPTSLRHQDGPVYLADL